MLFAFSAAVLGASHPLFGRWSRMVGCNSLEAPLFIGHWWMIKLIRRWTLRCRLVPTCHQSYIAFASGSPSCFSKACAVAGIAGHMKLHSWVLPFPPPGVFESSFAVAQSPLGHHRHIVATSSQSGSLASSDLLRLTLHFVSPDSSHRCSFTTASSSLYLPS